MPNREIYDRFSSISCSPSHINKLYQELAASQAEVERLRAFIKSKLPPPPYGELEPEWKYAEKLLAETAPAQQEADHVVKANKMVPEWRDLGAEKVRAESAQLRVILSKAQELIKQLRADVKVMRETIQGCGCDNHLQVYCDKHNPHKNNAT